MNPIFDRVVLFGARYYYYSSLILPGNPIASSSTTNNINPKFCSYGCNTPID